MDVAPKGLKNETEDLILAALNHALSRNAVKVKTGDIRDYILCRMCMKKDETVSPVVAGSESLPQKEYNRQHDKAALALQ